MSGGRREKKKMDGWEKGRKKRKKKNDLMRVLYPSSGPANIPSILLKILKDNRQHI